MLFQEHDHNIISLYLLDHSLRAAEVISWGEGFPLFYFILTLHTRGIITWMNIKECKLLVVINCGEKEKCELNDMNTHKHSLRVVCTLHSKEKHFPSGKGYD